MSGRTERTKEFIDWLQDSFGDDFTPPRLEAAGFEFAGGRLLPSARGPAAQMVYADQEDRYVTLYFVKSVQRRPIKSLVNLLQQTINGFETFFAQDDRRSIYMWEQEPLRYALVGEMDRKDLSVITEVFLSRLQTKPNRLSTH